MGNDKKDARDIRRGRPVPWQVTLWAAAAWCLWLALFGDGGASAWIGAAVMIAAGAAYHIRLRNKKKGNKNGDPVD